MYAAIGTDGINVVVWGLGDTPEAALDDASNQEGVQNESLETLEIDAAGVAHVKLGWVRVGIGAMIHRIGDCLVGR